MLAAYGVETVGARLAQREWIASGTRLGGRNIKSWAIEARKSMSGEMPGKDSSAFERSPPACQPTTSLLPALIWLDSSGSLDLEAPNWPTAAAQ